MIQHWWFTLAAVLAALWFAAPAPGANCRKCGKLPKFGLLGPGCAGCTMPPGCRQVLSTVELGDASSGRTFVLSPEAPVQ